MNNGGRKRSAKEAGVGKPSAKRTGKTGARFNTSKYSNYAGATIGSSVGGAGAGIPLKLFTKLKYSSTNCILDVAGGTATRKQFRLNSLFDPDLSGVGHQPFRFDQFVAMGYNNYVVHAVKVLIIPQFSTSAASGCPLITARIDAGGVSAGDSNTEIERSFKYMFLDNMGQNNGATAWMSCIQTPRHIKFYRKIKTLLGRKIDLAADGAAVSANPTTSLLLNLLGLDSKDAATIEVRCNVIMTFYAQFYNTYGVAQS